MIQSNTLKTASNCLGGALSPPFYDPQEINMSTDVQIDEKIKKEIKEPSNYNVIMLNDDATPMEWVVQILQEIYRHNLTSAQEIMLTIHNEGSAIVGNYKYEIAEQKSIETVNLSRNHGFPLLCKVEEE
jgi:ATP-dependent Clp protease adaptor protein ClpS